MQIKWRGWEGEREKRLKEKVFQSNILLTKRKETKRLQQPENQQEKEKKGLHTPLT